MPTTCFCSNAYEHARRENEKFGSTTFVIVIVIAIVIVPITSRPKTRIHHTSSIPKVSSFGQWIGKLSQNHFFPTLSFNGISLPSTNSHLDRFKHVTSRTPSTSLPGVVYTDRILQYYIVLKSAQSESVNIHNFIISLVIRFAETSRSTSQLSIIIFCRKP